MFFVETCFYFWCFLICFVVTEAQLKFHFSYFGYFFLRFPLLFYYQNITLVWWCLLVLLFISLISGIRLHFFMHTLVFPWLMQQGKLQVLYCKMLLILVFYLQYWCANTRLTLNTTSPFSSVWIFSSIGAQSWIILLRGAAFFCSVYKYFTGHFKALKLDYRLSVLLVLKKLLFILMICYYLPTLLCHQNHLGKLFWLL